MKSKKILVELIELIDKFEKHNSSIDGDFSLNDFIRFLLENRQMEEDRNDIVHIAKNVSYMHRYSNFYIKKALKGSLLQTIDEYTYLAELFNGESLSKTEINNRNVIEKTSGNVILKRLLNAGLIGERQDEEDKRRIRTFITEKGKSELLKVFPELWKSATILSGILSPIERQLLLKTSERLCNFHKDIFINDKDEQLDNILKKLPTVNQMVK